MSMKTSKRTKSPLAGRQSRKFNVRFEYNGRVLDEKFETVYDAFVTFKPETIKNKIFFRAECGTRKVERTLFAPFARRIFFNDSATRIFTRNVERAIT